jgi:hypothetical protein
MECKMVSAGNWQSNLLLTSGGFSEKVFLHPPGWLVDLTPLSHMVQIRPASCFRGNNLVAIPFIEALRSQILPADVQRDPAKVAFLKVLLDLFQQMSPDTTPAICRSHPEAINIGTYFTVRQLFPTATELYKDLSDYPSPLQLGNPNASSPIAGVLVNLPVKLSELDEFALPFQRRQVFFTPYADLNFRQPFSADHRLS